MQDDTKVFTSVITRGNTSSHNNLYDLINVTPAVPIKWTNNNEDEKNFDFKPNTDKHFTPKKRNTVRVKTVRYIRDLYEQDMYTYLPQDLENQQNFLLRKVTDGSSRHEDTKKTTKLLIKNENPVSRPAWQMLMNLNPEEHPHCFQYVLWNGKCIRVNGSRGGRNKFLCHYDLANKKVPQKHRRFLRKLPLNKKKGLLRNSLSVKFKPGPLTRKIHLDDSYQKYNVGGTELVNLPKPGLTIQPKYGAVLEPAITNLIQNLREVDGLISKTWAEFAVTTLVTLNNMDAVQDTRCSVTFELNYKSAQQRLLMRRDIDNRGERDKSRHEESMQFTSMNDISDIKREVWTVVNNMLDAVEISLQQNNMYSGEDQPREILHDDCSALSNNANTKDKTKKTTELDRLDVTIIRLHDLPQEENVDICQKSHCSLGCICASLQCGFKLKRHCGLVECMFGCKCDFSKFKVMDTFESDYPELLPGLLSLENDINLKLAKEEQKFHQTVVMTGEKSILLKSKKRTWKASKKYADFYSSLSLKTEMKVQPVLSVVTTKLNCNNIEPWCMVHNLYKCFCKGKFTNNWVPNVDQVNHNETVVHQDVQSDLLMQLPDNNVRGAIRHKHNIRPEKHIKLNPKRHSVSECEDKMDLDTTSICARIKPYKGRKFYDSHYISANKKIFEMEKNDIKLHKKMMSIINNCDSNNDTNILQKTAHDNDNSRDDGKFHFDDDADDIENNESNISFNPSPESLDGHVTTLPTSDVDVTTPLSSQSASAVAMTDVPAQNLVTEENPYEKSSSPTSTPASLPNKTKLIAWLESSYKQYKQRVEQGTIKTSLDPPKQGKMALYSWDFILRRYKERKNLFLISTQRPYRIFMAVDIKNRFFKNCMNIDDIRFADLHNYPLTIRNLLTNATDLKDNFCILCGLSHCWELIGSVTKVKERTNSISDSEEKEPVGTIPAQKDICSENLSNVADIMELNLQEVKVTNCTAEENLETSKWFVMTVENDFTEIQFHNRGFFVKYESIIKAINVARMSGKTVRLSAQKCADQNNSPQFGIYAIPNANEYCVFIGPYEKDELLGIETLRSIPHVQNPKSTRGVWITTKKMDNLKVIDDPLFFMPPDDLPSSEIVPMEDIAVRNSAKVEETPQTSKEITKSVKPIKIRKTDGFYHLAPKGFLKQITLPPPKLKPHKGLMILNSQQQTHKKTNLPLNTSSMSKKRDVTTINPPALVSPLTSAKNSSSSTTTFDVMSSQQSFIDIENKRPVAEIAPQIKIVECRSLNTDNNDKKKSEGGMFILKPEEINKRLMQSRGISKQAISSGSGDNFFSSDVEIDQDIENFIANSEICTLPNADIYVISDEEDECKNNAIEHKTVWIECKNIDNLGWIRGRRNMEKCLSFAFPGFKYTDFYTEKQAFYKINQVLSRKIYVPKSLKLEWHVVESEADLKTKHVLKLDELGVDFVLTKRGPRHKKHLKAISRSILKTNACKLDTPQSPLSGSDTNNPDDDFEKMSNMLTVLEEQSKKLEDEGRSLLREFKMKSAGIKHNFPVVDQEKNTEA